nr:uncharacterized protein LOC123480294 [Desmodus rotundus]
MTQGRLDAGTYKAKRKRNPRPRWALFKLGRSFCRQSTEALTTSHQSAGTTVYQDRGAVEKPGGPLDQYKNTDTASQKVVSPQRRWLRRCWTPILCALGAPGDGRSLPLLRPYASLLPHHSSKGGGAPPGCAKAHVTPTHLPCAGLVEASWRLWLLRQLNTPAGRQLAPFVSAGQSPRCLPRPALLRAPLPQVPQDLVQGGGQENPRADSPTLESPKGNMKQQNPFSRIRQERPNIRRRMYPVLSNAAGSENNACGRTPARSITSVATLLRNQEQETEEKLFLECC